MRPASCALASTVHGWLNTVEKLDGAPQESRLLLILPFSNSSHSTVNVASNLAVENVLSVNIKLANPSCPGSLLWVMSAITLPVPTSILFLTRLGSANAWLTVSPLPLCVALLRWPRLRDLLVIV